jgi:ketol-acid reductoisomerase
LRVYRETDADLDLLKGKRIAILGLGGQGKAQALNLRDSGLEVTIGLRPQSPSKKKAEELGFEVQSLSESCLGAELISFLIPDQVHKEVYEQEVRKNLKEGKCLVFAHAFSIHFKLIEPPDHVDVILVAPHGPGEVMRQRFQAGLGVSGFVGVFENRTGKALQKALAYAKGIGLTRSGVMETSFEHEALGDLFGEQAVLCGGLVELLEAGFETLVGEGLPPENAYLECVHQLDLIVDLIKRFGIAGMYSRISELAEFGSYVNGPRIIGERARMAMRAILEEIRKGEFTEQFMKSYRKGFEALKEKRQKEAAHPINQVFRNIGESFSSE